MQIWSAEIKELESLYTSVRDRFPELEKELRPLIKTEDHNVILLYARRCLEVIITDLCECELKKSRGTEPLKGIIDKLNREGKVPSHIITSMDHLNSLSTYGTHPKDFDPEQVKPVLVNLDVVIKWYLKYKVPGMEVISGSTEKTGQEIKSIEDIRKSITISKKRIAGIISSTIAVILIVFVVLYLSGIIGTGRQTREPEKSIAVLPFQNLSNDPEQEYFSDGLVEEILDRLCRISNLKVISRTSSSRYKNTNLSIKEIAAALGASAIMEGSVQKSDNKIRISVQLIDAKTDSHLWSKIFDNNYSDIFSIYSEVAQAVASEMNAAVTPEERQLIDKYPTNDMTAYDCYLKGIFHGNKLNVKDLEISMQYFEQAKKIDPDFALAYAGIARVWIARQQMGIVKVSEAEPKSKEALLKALELDSTQSEVQRTLGGRRVWTDWDWKEGEEAFRNAIKLNPNNALAHSSYSHLLNILGRPDEAMEQIKIALELDPLNPNIRAFYGIDLMFIHRFDDAVAAFREALELSPEHMVALSNLDIALHFAGRDKEALEALRNFLKNKNPDVLKIVEDKFPSGDYALVMRKIGDYRVERKKTTYIRSLEIVYPYLLACEVDKAIYWLEKAYEEHEPNLPYLLLPQYDILRDDPRFQDMARRMNLPYK